MAEFWRVFKRGASKPHRATTVVETTKGPAYITSPPLRPGTHSPPQVSNPNTVGGLPFTSNDVAKVLGGDPLIVGAGFALANAFGGVTQAVTGSEGKGDFARIFGAPATVGFGTEHAVVEGFGWLGASKDDRFVQASGEGAGYIAAGATWGAMQGPAAIIAVPVGVGIGMTAATMEFAAEGASAAIGAIGGEQAEKDVRAAVAQLDPTSSTSAVGQGVGAVADVVKALNPFKGLF